MVGSVWCVLGSILGCGIGEVIWGTLCGDHGDISKYFGCSGIMDSSYLVSTLFGFGPIVERSVPKIFMSNCCFHWRIILCAWADPKLFCYEFNSSTVHIWNINR